MRCFPARGPDTAAYAPGLKRIWCRPAGRRLRTERCRERMRPVRRRRRFPGRTRLPGPAGDSAGTDDLRPDCRRVKRLPRRNQGRAGRIFGTVVPRAGGGGLGGAGIRRQGVSLHRPGGRCRLRPEGGGAFRRGGYDRRGPFERVREAGRQAVPARQPRARRTAAAARGGARCRNYRAVRASFPSRCRPTGHAAHRLRAQYSVTSCSSACDSKALRGDTPPSRQPRM